MSRERQHHITPRTLAVARQLRQPQTPAEARLWTRLRDRQLGPKFRRQHPIGRFIVDFCCPTHRLVIEIDGDTHEGQQEYDAQRTARLREQGYRVIRFTNEDVRERLESVLEAILLECQGEEPEQNSCKSL